MLRNSGAALLLLALAAAGQEYKPGPDSFPQPGVPAGSVTRHSWKSTLFPGSVRDYWVYVPAQYKPDGKPACVMVFQDGSGFVDEKGSWRANIVFDNLIHRGEMPVTIGVFINPGVLPALTPEAVGRYNRSYEYDAVTPLYARFLIEEILPEVGKSYKLSSDPNDRAIAGSSSGGIAAFTAAWYRPDAFRRVLSFIGSYTNLRGGFLYSSLIRKSEGKPLRVYLQDGRNDQNIYSGSWFLANEDMAAALQYANYDYTFTIGNEGHNGKHGSAILPDALRWLWRGYPAPIATPKGGGERRYISEILDPESGWELMSQGHKFTEGPAVDQAGNVYFTDIPNNRIHKIAADGKTSVFQENSGGANGLMFGADGRMYVCQNGKKRIVAYSADGTETVLAEGVESNDLAIGKKGDLYFTDPANKRVWLLDAKGNKRIVAKDVFEFPNGVRFSADQSLLLVNDSRGRWVWSYQIQADGSLENGQPFYRLETWDLNANTAADGMTVDTLDHLYVTTRLGVQILDPAGRVVGILHKPQESPLSNAVFGGPERNYLYVTAGDKVFRRKLRRKGTVSWEPVKLAPPRL